jgi:hypothetical protein
VIHIGKGQAVNVKGVLCSVQHPVKTGLPGTTEPGRLLVGAVEAGDGEPRLMFEIHHPDGTSLGALVDTSELILFLDCVLEAQATAERLVQLASQGGGTIQ